MLHRRREKFPRHAPCHVTLRVRGDVPSLRTARFVREAERTLAEACERGNARLVHYSIQSNHVHMLVEATGREALANAMKAIGARLARAVNRCFAAAARFCPIATTCACCARRPKFAVRSPTSC